MPVGAFAQQNGTLQELQDTSDGALGQNTAAVALTPIRFRIGVITSKLALTYQRQGWEYVVRLQIVNRLPKLTKGRRFLAELFKGGRTERLRIVFDGRTLSPVAVRPIEHGQGPSDFVNVDCIDTPEAVGFQDK